MKKLTPTQQKLFDSMEEGNWKSAYELRTSLSTLNAMAKKGYLARKLEVGYLFFPRNEILFCKKYGFGKPTARIVQVGNNGN